MLVLDRPVSTSSNSLFEGLPNILHPVLPQFSIPSGILLSSLVTCRRKFELCLLSFSSTGSNFKSS